MPFFDSQDWADPKTQGIMGMLAGMAKGFGQAAMPGSLPIPLGAALSMGADGAYSGMKSGANSALDFGGKQSENKIKGYGVTNAAVGADQALIIENLIRRSLGKPPLTAADIASGGHGVTPSPMFGMPTLSPSSRPAPSQAAAAPANGQAPAPTPAPAADGSDAAPANDSVGNAMVTKLLSGGMTDYQKAKMAADLMPPGPAKMEAERAASKIAGINVTLSQRSGEASSLYNPETGKYEEVSRNPNLSQDLDYDPVTHTAKPVPGALEGLAQIEAVKQGAHGQREKNVKGFENFLDTGGMGAADASGNIKPPTPEGVHPDYAARVHQLESGGNPDAKSGTSSATGQDQFINSTWLNEAKRFLPPEMTQGKTDQQLLALRNDPNASTMVTNGYAAQNAPILAQAGIKNVGPTELYMAHHFGPQGAAAILKAPVNTPLSEIMPPEVLAANPDLKNATVGDVYAHANHGMSGMTSQQPKAVLSGNTGGVKSNIPPVSEAAKIPQGEIYLKDRIPQWTKHEDEWADALPSNVTGEQRALAIAEALKSTQSGQWATVKAAVAAKLKAVGIDIGKNSWFGDPGAVQTAIKDNFQATLAQIRAFTSRPAAVEVQLASKNFANPDLQPEANLKIIGQVVGSMRWERALMNDWAVAKGQGWQDPQDFQRAWIQKNPLQKYIDSSIKEIGPLKGMAGAVKINAKDQALITPENIAHSAQQAGISEEQMKAKLRAAGYHVSD